MNGFNIINYDQLNLRSGSPSPLSPKSHTETPHFLTNLLNDHFDFEAALDKDESLPLPNPLNINPLNINPFTSSSTYSPYFHQDTTSPLNSGYISNDLNSDSVFSNDCSTASSSAFHSRSTSVDVSPSIGVSSIFGTHKETSPSFTNMFAMSSFHNENKPLLASPFDEHEYDVSLVSPFDDIFDFLSDDNLDLIDDQTLTIGTKHSIREYSINEDYSETENLSDNNDIDNANTLHESLNDNTTTTLTTSLNKFEVTLSFNSDRNKLILCEIENIIMEETPFQLKKSILLKKLMKKHNLKYNSFFKSIKPLSQLKLEERFQADDEYKEKEKELRGSTNRFYSRLNCYDLSEILELNQYQLSLTKLVESNILNIASIVWNFKIGTVTWSRDLKFDKRKNLLKILARYTLIWYPEFGLNKLEAIIKRGFYKAKQAQLRRIRRKSMAIMHE